MADLANTFGEPQLGLRRRHQARLFQQQQAEEEEDQENDGDGDDSNSILADDDEEEGADDGHGDDESTNSQNGPRQQQRRRQQQQQQQPVRGWIQRILFPQHHQQQQRENNPQQGPRRVRQWRRVDPRTTGTRLTPNNHLIVDDPSITFRASRAYCLFSTMLAILAIVAATPPPKLSLLWTGQPLLLSAVSRESMKEVGTTKNSNSSPSQGNLANLSPSSNDKSSLLVAIDSDGDDRVFASPRDWWQAIQQLWNPQVSTSTSGTEASKQEVDRNGNDKQSRLTSSTTTESDDKAIKNPAWWARLLFIKPTNSNDTNDNRSHDSTRNNKKKQPPKDSQHGAAHNNHRETTVPLSSHRYYREVIHTLLRRYRAYMRSWIDPVLLHPTSHTPTDIIDKVLTSTPRLLAIANFLLAMTYLLHSAVAAWFLGPEQPHHHQQQEQQHQQQEQQQEPVQVPLMVDWANGTATIPPGGNRHPTNATAAAALNNASGTGGARERMGGFLIFKLLLISAVVAPDTLDLLILLTWYTTLSCLRSLDYLAHATTTHLAALGQPPRTGVVQLLFLVLVCDIVAAASCVALFHAAGWGMVVLLTCDCALLAADVLRHILKHFLCTLEDAHTTTIQDLERQQLNLHHTNGSTATRDRNGNRNIDDDVGSHENSNDIQDRNDDNRNVDSDGQQLGGIEPPANHNMTPIQIQQESRRLDREMEGLELAHTRRLSILDSVMFTLELLCHCLTVAHFCHIWSLHGVQFTLIDGVLALHLHSAISTVCKKIAQRRNVHSIARDLQGHFPNATDEELRKASAAGDVCCICLGTMSTGGHVKKLRCGHLHHTHCLREVVERAHSIQAAKCPLCRASLIDGTHRYPESGDDQQRNVVAVPALTAQQQQGTAVVDARPAGAGERALFRFSTEGILPTWLPIPAFSFEVVRRSPLGGVGGIPGGAQQQLQFLAQQQPQLPQENGVMAIPSPPNASPQADGGPQDVLYGANDNGDRNMIQDNPIPPSPIQLQEPHDQPEMPTTSFLRRLLVLAGAIPMSPEEEARALAQLVDMFPQYDRSDLLRELQERGSAEGVAEAILMGIFSGVPRGD